MPKRPTQICFTTTAWLEVQTTPCILAQTIMKVPLTPVPVLAGTSSRVPPTPQNTMYMHAYEPATQPFRISAIGHHAPILIVALAPAGHGCRLSQAQQWHNGKQLALHCDLPAIYMLTCWLFNHNKMAQYHPQRTNLKHSESQMIQEQSPLKVNMTGNQTKSTKSALSRRCHVAHFICYHLQTNHAVRTFASYIYAAYCSSKKPRNKTYYYFRLLYTQNKLCKLHVNNQNLHTTPCCVALPVPAHNAPCNVRNCPNSPSAAAADAPGLLLSLPQPLSCSSCPRYRQWPQLQLQLPPLLPSSPQPLCSSCPPYGQWPQPNCCCRRCMLSSTQ